MNLKLNVLVAGLAVAMLLIPAGVRGQAPAIDPAQAVAIPVAEPVPLAISEFADTVLLDEETAGVAAETGILTEEGFTAQLDLWDEFGVLLWSDFAQVAPNGSLLFPVDSTTLLMQSGDLTLDVLRHDPATNQVSVAATLILMPLVLMTSTDSVSQTTARVIATGDLVQIRTLLAIARDTGGLTAVDVAALEAAAARIAAAAAAAAARQAAITAAQQAGQRTLQNTPVGSNAFNAARGSIMRAFFDHGFKPVMNAFNAAIMRSYITAANAIIASYTATIATLTNPAKIAEFQRKIAFQQERIAQITGWFTANGQTP